MITNKNSPKIVNITATKQALEPCGFAGLEISFRNSPEKQTPAKRESNKRWRERNPEYSKSYSKRWREKNKNRAREYEKKRYREGKKQRFKHKQLHELTEEQRINRQEQQRVSSKIYREKNKKRLRAKNKKWWAEQAVAKLKDSYVKNKLSRETGIPIRKITPIMVNLKRELLIFHRLEREVSDGIANTGN